MKTIRSSKFADVEDTLPTPGALELLVEWSVFEISVEVFLFVDDPPAKNMKKDIININTRRFILSYLHMIKNTGQILCAYPWCKTTRCRIIINTRGELIKKLKIIIYYFDSYKSKNLVT